MKKFQLLALSSLLAAVTFSAAYSQDPTDADIPPSPRLIQLTSTLPAVGKIGDMKKMGLGMFPSEKLPPPIKQDAATYIYTIPKNLDRGSTDQPPFAGKYPGVHLNLPLQVQKSYINYLFISDQPERILDTRKREMSPAQVASGANVTIEPGATGVYARSPIPAKSTCRVLVDHTNGTKRPLRFFLMWMPEQEGFLSVKKRSQSVHKDSVAAGSRSFVDAGTMAAEPRIGLEPNVGVELAEATLKPEDTVVLQMEMFTSAAGQLVAIVVEDGQEIPRDLAALDNVPILHSILWQEEEERLGKFIDSKADPKRYERIKNSAQHARGHFQFPDRATSIDYSVGSWKESESPAQLYSLFESIPGTDSTVVNGSSVSDNRGKYGARVGLKINIKDLPPGCTEMALLAVNRGDVYGGRHWVSDGHKTAFETYLRPNVGQGVLRKGQACNIWQGPVRIGDTLTMWTEPMANTSVQLMYVLVPLPPAAPSPVVTPVPAP